MDNISQNIYAALIRAKKITEKKAVNILRSNELRRSDREILLKTNWLQEIIRGWYMLVRPDVSVNDSAAWYANFWDFIRIYLHARFGKKYCLSAESSLDLYVEAPLIPRQVIVIVSKGGSKVHTLLYGTSILFYTDTKNIPKEKNIINGLQVMELPMALCKASSTYFKNNMEDAEIALRLIKNPSDLSKTIIKYNFRTAANRLVGAYKFLGDNAFARTITEDLETIGVAVKPENPLQKHRPLIKQLRVISPYVARIETLWAELRGHVLEVFEKVPQLSKPSLKYLTLLDEIYKDDAYNSLSIEGYEVTAELIERVKNNRWNPDLNLEDQNMKNVLAARGYYEAFQAVKKSIEKILRGKNAGIVLARDLQDWYRKLFLPNVKAGIINLEQLLGYRDDRVYIRGSRHVPPPKEAVIDAMEALFNCIKMEPSSVVRAILGHYLFVFIHPYMDGNGRIARFLMNVMLISGGYAWTVIENKHRKSYMDALRLVDERRNLKPFAQFILKSMMKNY